MSDVVRLRVGGVLFEVEKSVLLRFDHTYFHGLFSSGAWQPEADGAHFIVRPAMGFDRILEYLRSGELSVHGLSELEQECLYSSLDYLLIPYKSQWKYDTHSVIEGFSAWYVFELKDGRLCGAYENDIIVWNMDTSAIEMTLNGHTYRSLRVFQLQDGQVCSCSDDRTIKLWSIDSGVCELTLTGHTDEVLCIMQLSDGRVCSCSWDRTVRVWSTSTGVCEMTVNSQYAVNSIAQLLDCSICYGDIDGTISINSSLTGECELSWKGHTSAVNAIVCIDSTRICTGSGDRTIKVWNAATGECERTIAENINPVASMVLMQDGRLYSGSWDGTLRLWNLETGECEKTLNTRSNCWQVLQLGDGRLLCACSSGAVVVWS